MSGQSPLMSMIEVSISITIGFCIALLAQLFIFKIFNIEVSLEDNLIIVTFFTVISLVRSYCVRRFFNWIHNRTQSYGAEHG